jgi:LacI family transcriptional regulator, galactose operon repressor
MGHWMKKRLHKLGRKVRLHDVADLVGCSTATVSRALNNPKSVGADIREKVYLAKEKLGYVPNSAARALRSRRTKIVGAIIPTMDQAIFAKLVSSLTTELAANGYGLLVATSEFNPVRELAQARILVERGTEGIVLVGDSHDPELYSYLEYHGVPYVNTYVFNPDSGHPCIGFENKSAAARAADFLADLGHTEFAFIAAMTENNDRSSARVAGVRSALQRRGLKLPEKRVVERRHTIEGGRDALSYLISQTPAPTAVLCGSDVLAFGALSKCTEFAVPVPDAISIVGFDNQDFAAHLNPPLTTIDISSSEMGRLAGEYLVAYLHGKPVQSFTELEARLIVRRTTAAPPASRQPMPATTAETA